MTQNASTEQSLSTGIQSIAAKQRRPLAVTVSAALAGLLAVPSAARAQLEEVVVTAQLRETTLQETPVAVTALSGETTDIAQIRDLRDLQTLAPTLRATTRQAPGASDFSIRGLGTSADNIGLEPSVGVFVDGVYRARGGAAINDFLGLQRVEILRGPQSTLFGKNTPAGVISFITREPGYEPTVEGEITAGRFDQVILKGALETGIVDDVLALRIDLNRHERDGFLDNVVQDEQVNDRDRQGARVQLLFEPANDLKFRFIADYNSLEESCCAAPFLENFPPNEQALLALGATVLPDDPFNRDVAFDGVVASELDTSGVSLQMDWRLGGLTFTSISALRAYDEARDIDADFIDLSLADRRLLTNQYTTFTQELRLASDGGRRLDWLVGFYFLDQQLETTNQQLFGADLRPFADLASGGAITDLENLLAATRGVMPGTYLAPGDGLREAFDLGTTTVAVFGQIDWYLTDRLTLTTGLRYSAEQKDIAARIDIEDPFAALDLSNIPEAALLGLPPDVFLPLVPFQFNPPADDFQRDRDESNVAGQVILAYDVNEALSAYASYSRGFKAGGFNVSAFAAVNDNFEFDAETIDAFELGLKTTLFDDRGSLNLSLFDQTLKDFQSNVFTGTSFVLDNAGQVSVTGLEAEFAIEPVNDLVLTVAFTSLFDAKYDEYLNGPCADLDTSQSCLLNGTQDLSGFDLPEARDLTGAITVTYTRDLGPFLGFVRTETFYSGETSLGSAPDPRRVQEAYQLVNGSIGVRSHDERVELQLWARNIANENYQEGNFPSVGQPGSLNSYVGDPRTWGVTVRARY